GEGLLEVIAERHDPPPKSNARPIYTAVPTILLLKEFTNLLKAAKIENSRLIDCLNSVYQSERAFTISRSNRLSTGGKVIVPDVKLSIYATTTQRLLTKMLAQFPDLLSSGFFNRFLILPGTSQPWIDCDEEGTQIELDGLKSIRDERLTRGRNLCIGIR